MADVKPLNAKQLAVIDDLFEGRMEEPDMLEKHNVSRKLYNRWLVDESFNDHLDQRKLWEYRRCEFILAHYARVAASNLVRLTDCEKEESARKACIDVITMRVNLLASTRSSETPALPDDNPKLLTESPNFSPETAGKILAVLAEDKNN